MKKLILIVFKIALCLYVILCVGLYFFQEKLIFFPEPLNKAYAFNYGEHCKELHIEASDGKQLNGLLFKAENTKGLIFYLHGNAGSLRSWGDVAKTYTKLNYDVFILDYRSFGKSEGVIKNQDQLFDDNQLVYNTLKKQYNEQDIIILGYSIGTGMASKLASQNNPKHLILQAPYYSLTDMMRQRFSFVPTFILKYTFATNEYLKNCNLPITIFHGKQDAVIYYDSSEKLKKEFNQINLIPLQDQGHNGMTDNNQYQKELKTILN